MSQNAMIQLQFLATNIITNTIKNLDESQIGKIESELDLIASKNTEDMTIGDQDIRQILDCVHYSSFLSENKHSDWNLPLQAVLNVCTILAERECLFH